MNNYLLTSLSIITSFHDQGRSINDAFLPLVEHGIATINDENKVNHYSTEALQKEIKKNHGISISMVALVSLLKKLKKDGVVELLERGNFFRILDGNRHGDEFLRTINDNNKNIHKFISEFKSFSGDNRTESDIIAWIYEFIKKYSNIINIKHNSLVVNSIEEDSKAYETLIAFLSLINKNNSELVNTFINIYFGYNLCCLLNNSINGAPQVNLSDLHVYLDSNFILRLLDLQEGRFTAETREIYDILVRNKAKLVIFQETIEELKDVLTYYYQIYKKEKSSYSLILGDPGLIDGVLGAYFRRNLSFTQIEHLIDNIDAEIGNLNIKVDKLERYGVECTEKECDDLYKAKYYDKDDGEQGYRKKKCKHYIQIIKVIDYLRKRAGHPSSCLGNSYYIFLSCDLRLYYYVKSKNTSRKYPQVISQEILANDLLLFAPQEIKKLSFELMISLFTMSKHLDVHILDDLRNKMIEISKEQPGLKDYVILLTRNSENFVEINKIYSDEEEDNKRQLIELAEREKQKQIIYEKEVEDTILKAKNDVQEKENEKRALMSKVKVQQDEIKKLEDDIECIKKLMLEQKIRQYETEKKKWDKLYKTISFCSILLYMFAGALLGLIPNLFTPFTNAGQITALVIGGVIVLTGIIVIAFNRSKDNFWVKKQIEKRNKKLRDKYSIQDEDLK